MRAAKPRWHSLGSRSLPPASSWPGKSLRKWIGTLSPSVWSFKARRKQAHGAMKHQQQNSGSRGEVEAACTCKPSPAVLHIFVLCAGSPGCLLLLGCSPDALQVHPIALPLKTTKPRRVSQRLREETSVLTHCPGLPWQNTRSKQHPSRSPPDPRREELFL